MRPVPPFVSDQLTLSACYDSSDRIPSENSIPRSLLPTRSRQSTTAALNALQCRGLADVSRCGDLVWRTGCCLEIHLRNEPYGTAAVGAQRSLRCGYIRSR